MQISSRFTLIIVYWNVVLHIISEAWHFAVFLPENFISRMRKQQRLQCTWYNHFYRRKPISLTGLFLMCSRIWIAKFILLCLDKRDYHNIVIPYSL